MTSTFTNAAIRMAQDYDVTSILPILESGGLILYPTDTIWGLGCDATNPEAVAKVFDLKRRDYSKPFVLLVSGIDMLKKYVEQVHPRLETLHLYHKRPLTIIYEKGKNLPDICLGDGGTVAIRIPQDDFCKDLIDALGKPIVSTSANISTEPFPTTFGKISSEIIMGVDLVVKYRQWEKSEGTPSVIARLDAREELEFLR